MHSIKLIDYFKNKVYCVMFGDGWLIFEYFQNFYEVSKCFGTLDISVNIKCFFPLNVRSPVIPMCVNIYTLWMEKLYKKPSFWAE